jgi:hypothetical protein
MIDWGLYNVKAYLMYSAHRRNHATRQQYVLSQISFFRNQANHHSASGCMERLCHKYPADSSSSATPDIVRNSDNPQERHPEYIQAIVDILTMEEVQEKRSNVVPT